MDLSKLIQSRAVSADEAVRHIQSGNRIFLTGNCSTPQTVLAALVKHAPLLQGVEICQALTGVIFTKAFPNILLKLRHY